MVRHLTPPRSARLSQNTAMASKCRPASGWCSARGSSASRADGTVPEDAGAQAELCFANAAAVLAEAGMALGNIVRINAYVTDRAHLKPYMDVRNRLVSTPPPASTLMIVGGFATPEFKVEVEVVAAG